jgi:hypothetical protein
MRSAYRLAFYPQSVGASKRTTPHAKLAGLSRWKNQFNYRTKVPVIRVLVLRTARPLFHCPSLRSRGRGQGASAIKPEEGSE